MVQVREPPGDSRSEVPVIEDSNWWLPSPTKPIESGSDSDNASESQ